MIKRSLFTGFLFLSASVPALAQTSTWQATTDTVLSQFNQYYSFKDFNQDHFGWNAETKMNSVRSEILALGNSPDPQALRNSLLKFYESTRDLHVVASFSTESPYSVSRLPFAMRSAGTGKYFIISINRTVLPEASFPFQVGDEILSLNGNPIQTAVNEYLPSEFANRAYQQSSAERYALAHYDSLGKSVPTGAAMVTLKRQSTGALETYSVNWQTTLKAPPAKSKSASLRYSSVTSRAQEDLLDDLEAAKQTHAQVSTANDLLANYGLTGAKTPFFMDLGTVTWHSAATDPFYAYTSTMPNGKTMGFIRLNTYFPSDTEIPTLYTPAFYSLIERFVDANISVLILDQTNNGGGSLLYAYDMIKALIDQPVDPLMTVQWIVDPIHWELAQPWQAIHDQAVKAKTDPAALADLQNKFFIDKIVDQDFVDAVISESSLMLKTLADPQHARMSPEMPFEGVSFITPKAGKRYTGPILMLNNEKSVSAGDLSPTLFKNVKRAVMFGVKTPGAGAYATAWDAPANNPFGLLNSNMAFAQMNGAGHIPIQGHGVKPDIYYHVSEYDLTHGMAGYRAAVIKAAQRISH